MKLKKKKKKNNWMKGFVITPKNNEVLPDFRELPKSNYKLRGNGDG